MAVIRENITGGHDRSSEDRRRHKELVEDSIKNNIADIIAEESIIVQNRKKKIKVPIRSIKEYQFIYRKGYNSVASGDGTEKRGDRISIGNNGGLGQGGAGSAEGEDIYETEITIEELVGYLFDDLDLPDLQKKKLAEIECQKGHRNIGYQRKGIHPRLAKKRSVIERIKRKQSSKRTENKTNNYRMINNEETETDKNYEKNNDKERFPFKEEDLRYKRVKLRKNKDHNAVVICIMDVSGSMDQTKKYMARSFYFLLYQFIRMKYETAEIAFIAHTTVAKEVSEDEFFHRGESGGTYISSGYEKALEIIEERYNPANWNIYAFHCSDGDNWAEDNEKAIDAAQRLCEKCNLFGYGEIVPGYYSPVNTIKNELMKRVNSSNFALVTMVKKEDIFPALKKLLEKDKEQVYINE